jgi:hypothetical protein
LVHYPAFLHVEELDFNAFHQRHSKMISLIVVPLMTAETAIGLGFIICQNESQLRNADVFSFYCFFNLDFDFSHPGTYSPPA